MFKSGLGEQWREREDWKGMGRRIGRLGKRRRRDPDRRSVERLACSRIERLRPGWCLVVDGGDVEVEDGTTLDRNDGRQRASGGDEWNREFTNDVPWERLCLHGWGAPVFPRPPVKGNPRRNRVFVVLLEDGYF
jgi:hypothetical protein